MEQQHLKQLIEKVLTGQATAKEQQELDEWYAAQDAEHGLTSELDEDDKNAMGAALYGNIHERIQKRPAVVKWMMAAAAVVLVLMVAGTMWFFSKKQPVMLTSVWKVEKTGADIRNIRLPDGSTVWLNAETTIRYDSLFLNGKREIWLEGEGFFDVTHREGKPFEVHTGKVTTRVLGTAFNVDAYDTLQNNITVSVTRGKVSVFTAANSSGILLPNQRVVYEPDGSFTRNDSLAVNGGSWTSGEFNFRDIPYSELARRLERRFGVQIIFKDPGLRNCLFSGSFRADTPLQNMLEIIALVNRSTVEKSGANTYYIHGTKQCK